MNPNGRTQIASARNAIFDAMRQIMELGAFDWHEWTDDQKAYYANAKNLARESCRQMSKLANS